METNKKKGKANRHAQEPGLDMAERILESFPEEVALLISKPPWKPQDDDRSSRFLLLLPNSTTELDLIKQHVLRVPFYRDRLSVQLFLFFFTLDRES